MLESMMNLCKQVLLRKEIFFTCNGPSAYPLNTNINQFPARGQTLHSISKRFLAISLPSYLKRKASVQSIDSADSIQQRFSLS